MANTANYTFSTWQTDIAAAQAAQIDAFVLNSGYGMKHTDEAFADAFDAAKNADFKLLFSFDYSGTGNWSKSEVTKLLKQYVVHPSYYQHEGKPLVSTFEGFQYANDWAGIKEDVGDFVFVPDWTSAGPKRAAAVSSVDGLMCWDAWPDGTDAMNTTEDEQYMSILGDKLYMMPVSPWFYSNLPQFDKNWVWQGGDLWYTRWQQVLQLNPDFVQILTWNDYGESHYIGPLHEDALGILEEADAPFNYVEGMPHDAWRTLLPYLIEQYKEDDDKKREKVKFEEEMLTVWYRLSPSSACGTGNTTGNTASQHQNVLPPGQVLKDKVFYSALLDKTADVHVSIGGENGTAGWTNTPDDEKKGVYHGSVDIGDREGGVVVTLSRDGKFLAQMAGENIKTQKECPHNETNWNAWVGNATAVGGASSLPVQGWTTMVVVVVMVMPLFTAFF
ncbi:alpha-1,3-glucanase, partial [Aspergillus varians]